MVFSLHSCLVFVVITLLCSTTLSESTNLMSRRKCGHSHVLTNLTTFNHQHFEHATATKFIRDLKRQVAKHSILRNHQQAWSTMQSDALGEASAANSQGMRIHIDYQLDEIDAETRIFIANDLMPAAVSVIASAIQAKRPVQGNLFLPRYCVSYYSNFPQYCLEMQPNVAMDDDVWATCGHARHRNAFFEAEENCEPVDLNDSRAGFSCTRHDTPGVADTDFILYVTAVESSSCEYAVAYATYCSLDLDTNRPLAGTINLCPSSLSTHVQDFDHQVEVAVHELLHTLVFADSLFDKFINDDGERIPLENVVRTSIANDRIVRKIVSPTVVEETRRHFRCSTLDGAELEDEGGDGTAGSHWESRLFQGELMDGMSGINIHSDRHALSRLTLALLQDSGWYTVNWKSAGLLEWGKHAGCSFAEDTCEDYTAKHPNQLWFCEHAGRHGCTADLHAYGRCHSDELLNNCNVVVPFSNVDCKTSDHSRNLYGVDWGTRHGSSSFCLDIESPISHRSYQNGRITEITSSSRTADCYEMHCGKNGRYSIEILGKSIQCDASGQQINLNNAFGQFSSGAVYCPDRKRVCPTMGCPNECSGHGRCHKRKCYCHLGYTGRNCSARICNAASTSCECSLYGGKTYGRCVDRSEGNEHLLLSSSRLQQKAETLKVILTLESSDEDTIRSALPQVFAEVILSVDEDDVEITAIKPAGHDGEDDRISISVSTAIPTEVVLVIYTADRAALRTKLHNADYNGDLNDALKQIGMTYLSGSLRILPSDTSEENEEDDDSELKRAIVIAGGCGILIFIILTAFRCYSLWLRPRQRLGNSVAELSPMHRRNPLSS